MYKRQVCVCACVRVYSIAKHLSRAYGTKAFEVAKIAEDIKLGQRLVRGHPFIEADVWSARVYLVGCGCV